MTQTELARQVDCKQSAISMFESGRGTALAADTIERITAVLGLESFVADSAAQKPGRIRELTLKYCPIAECPSAIPYAVGGQLCLKPTMIRAERQQKTRCDFCGELMEHACPNQECAAPLQEGSFCRECGTAYITPAVNVPAWQLTEWADRQRERIREIREMSRTRGEAEAS